jgi:ankyrin repeat protein
MGRRIMQVVSLLSMALGMAEPARSQSPQDRFWEAAISGDTAALAAALADGARVDSLDLRRSPNGRLALNWAAINNRVSAIQFLLAHGAAIEGTNITGFTALHHAAEYGALEAARVLLAAGADPAHRNRVGLKPADTAREEGHIEVALLIAASERGERPK